MSTPVSQAEAPAFGEQELLAHIRQIRRPLHVVTRISDGSIGVAWTSESAGHRLLGTLPPLYPEWLGDRSFGTAHEVRFPYVAGEMANGIATTRLVIEMARAEMLAFFGAGGLDHPRVEQAVEELSVGLRGARNWGVNLIHSPAEPELEERIAELLVRREVPRISVSAYLELTPAVVRCSATGLSVDRQGGIIRRARLFAKVSHPDVAAKFMSPAPAELLRVLVGRGQLTEAEARLAARVPVAEDITVEADSGGHTDNRPLVVILPAMLALRDELHRCFGYTTPIRVGAAGGLGTPGGVAAAFALGAAYVMTGSVNQMSVEAGVSDEAKAMLAEAGLADVMMAPAADMFELGVRLQVLRRGTMFGPRAVRLYETYREYDSLEAVPEPLRIKIERTVLRASFDEVWEETRRFWEQRDPVELERAERDPRHRMALTFRWYLGRSSHWAIEGETGRRTDYQLWCGPAVGAFNQWVTGSFLAQPAARSVIQIARNLLEGAAVITRAHQLRTFGLPVPAVGFSYEPRRLA
ncbi:PfaD family polyunsaturated fatty acid/polyketide biosynthesis protein [Actinomadura alba]|uniref:PfaD family polyunsaturated fatty acid/polyketide biosynthesis protein n=1 Tax=Actinomadura alba TaxID=406431 RepID=A0ABR7LJS2_9ACTN|nr:PfaD family polyunsaturated fatty acid/polyketide biosynthesis protein [Actinomadura alba]MBC6465066.1 PfaD family polyunsaturated fatty acid/polyketide biosynthesis protein [Actinomadura alba]